MSEHTKGPWRIGAEVESQGDLVYIPIETNIGKVSTVSVYGHKPNGKTAGEKYKDAVGDFRHKPFIRAEEAKANARRIVACVNYAEGVSTQTLEQVGTGMLNGLMDERDHLASLNRELVEALEFNAKELENLCKRGNGSWSASRIKADCEGLAEHARAVLAKVKS